MKLKFDVFTGFILGGTGLAIMAAVIGMADHERDFLEGDPDQDSVRYDVDNCTLVSNADQSDKDGDGWGDLCDKHPEVARGSDCIWESDSDKDGVDDLCDNCVYDPNPGQGNLDGDEAGDACDAFPRDPWRRSPPASGGLH